MFKSEPQQGSFNDTDYYCEQLIPPGSFYRKFRDNFKKDRTGAHTLETVTGKSAAALQTEWVAWVKTLRYPAR